MLEDENKANTHTTKTASQDILVLMLLFILRLLFLQSLKNKKYNKETHYNIRLAAQNTHTKGWMDVCMFLTFSYKAVMFSLLCSFSTDIYRYSHGFRFGFIGCSISSFAIKRSNLPALRVMMMTIMIRVFLLIQANNDSDLKKDFQFENLQSSTICIANQLRLQPRPFL